MSDLQTQFEAAAEDVKKLPRRPDDDTLLELYSWYKQATAGDVTGKRPGFTDFAGRAKYDAWAGRKGISKDEAMRAYIRLVESLKQR
jgi:acyl-CoA-binding protein